MGNSILSGLPPIQRQRLEPHLTPVIFEEGDVLHQAGECPATVTFPRCGLLSLLIVSSQGVEVETGVIGKEGVSGAGPVLARSPALSRLIVQVPGDGWQMSASAFRAEFRCGGELQDLVACHLELMTAQAAQCALCNRLHTVEERLSRWLLLTGDILESEQFVLSMEFIACMLGARRSSVPIALGVLQQAGLIDLSKNRISILDRARLEAAACECYGLLRGRFAAMEDAPSLVDAAIF